MAGTGFDAVMVRDVDDHRWFEEWTSCKHFEVRLDRDLPYEVDGGDRDPATRLDIHVEPLAVAFRVP